MRRKRQMITSAVLHRANVAWHTKPKAAVKAAGRSPVPPRRPTLPVMKVVNEQTGQTFFLPILASRVTIDAP